MFPVNTVAIFTLLSLFPVFLSPMLDSEFWRVNNAVCLFETIGKFLSFPKGEYDREVETLGRLRTQIFPV